MTTLDSLLARYEAEPAGELRRERLQYSCWSRKWTTRRQVLVTDAVVARADSFPDRAPVKRKYRNMAPDAMGTISLEDRGLLGRAVSAGKFSSVVPTQLPWCDRQCS